MQTPSNAQKRFLNVIWELTMERGWPPTVRELAERYGTSSTNGVLDMLKVLQKYGWVVRDNMAARCLKLTGSGFEAAGIDSPENPYTAA